MFSFISLSKLVIQSGELCKYAVIQQYGEVSYWFLKKSRTDSIKQNGDFPKHDFIQQYGEAQGKF